MVVAAIIQMALYYLYHIQQREYWLGLLLYNCTLKICSWSKRTYDEHSAEASSQYATLRLVCSYSTPTVRDTVGSGGHTINSSPTIKLHGQRTPHFESMFHSFGCALKEDGGEGVRREWGGGSFVILAVWEESFSIHFAGNEINACREAEKCSRISEQWFGEGRMLFALFAAE